MHELGLVYHIIKTVTEVAEENEIDRIDKVVLEIGEVSGVVHHYLIDCWNWSVKKTDLLKSCELVIEDIEAITFCTNCDSYYSTIQYGKICPYCLSDKTYLYMGDEMNIKEIQIDN